MASLLLFWNPVDILILPTTEVQKFLFVRDFTVKSNPIILQGEIN